MSNLKQIGLGIAQYTQDYDEKYPQHVQSSFGSVDNYATSSTVNWIACLQPYIKSQQLFICPAATKASGTSMDPNGESDTSYTYNGLVIGYSGDGSFYYSGSGGNPSSIPIMNISAIAKPTELIQVHEFSGLRTNRAQLAPRWQTDGTHWRMFLWDRDDLTGHSHFESENALFADGHVKWMNRNTLLRGVTLRSDGVTLIGSSSTGGEITGSQSWFNPYKQ